MRSWQTVGGASYVIGPSVGRRIVRAGRDPLKLPAVGRRPACRTMPPHDPANRGSGMMKRPAHVGLFALLLAVFVAHLAGEAAAADAVASGTVVSATGQPVDGAEVI